MGRSIPGSEQLQLVGLFFVVFLIFKSFNFHVTSQQLLNEENLRKQEESVQKQEAIRRGRPSPRMGGFVGHLSP